MRYRTLGRFGAVGNPDHDSIRIIHKALDFGINVVDTADRYSAGESEEIVGKALQGRRDDVVLASKVNLPMGEDPNQRGNSRRWIVTEVENSLRRLQTDHGKVRTAPHRAAALLHRQPGHRTRGTPGLPALRHGHPDLEPLGQGLLTGRIRKGRQADSRRLAFAPKHLTDERKLDVVEQLIPLAEKAGLSMTHWRWRSRSPTPA